MESDVEGNLEALSNDKIRNGKGLTYSHGNREERYLKVESVGLR